MAVVTGEWMKNKGREAANRGHRAVPSGFFECRHISIECRYSPVLVWIMGEHVGVLPPHPVLMSSLVLGAKIPGTNGL
jgi:hypothetical protein